MNFVGSLAVFSWASLICAISLKRLLVHLHSHRWVFGRDSMPMSLHIQPDKRATFGPRYVDLLDDMHLPTQSLCVWTKVRPCVCSNIGYKHQLRHCARPAFDWLACSMPSASTPACGTVMPCSSHRFLRALLVHWTMAQRGGERKTERNKGTRTYESPCRNTFSWRRGNVRRSLTSTPCVQNSCAKLT